MASTNLGDDAGTARLVFVPVDAITQPTGRFELDDTLPAVAPATRPTHASRRKLARLGVAFVLATGMGLLAMAATSRAATTAPPRSPDGSDVSELARRYASLAVLEALPASSPSIEHALADQHAAIGMALAERQELAGAVTRLTAALVILDDLATRDAANRSVALARARIDRTLALISMQRGQVAKASIYLRAGIAITEPLISTPADDTEARTLARELRSTLSKL